MQAFLFTNQSGPMQSVWDRIQLLPRRYQDDPQNGNGGDDACGITIGAGVYTTGASVGATGGVGRATGGLGGSGTGADPPVGGLSDGDSEASIICAIGALVGS